MIKVFDDVLSEDLLNFVSLDIRDASWNVQSSNVEDNPNFFICDTTGLLLSSYLLSIFNDKKYTKTIRLLRSYINCYPPHSHGEFHRDDGNETLLFFTDEWDENFKGDLLFKDKDPVPYKRNRLVVFDSNLEHKADTNLSNKNRHTIAWKTTT